jgi:DNA-binding NtrC family response regulator
MGKRILIIDDDEAVRKAFHYALRATDYEVEMAASGEEGVRKALAASHDLVYLDLRMPDKDGIAVLREIRAVKPDLPVYIATAFHREYFKDLVKARNEGLAFELLSKPLERDQIIAITRGILDGAILLHERAAGD